MRCINYHICHNRVGASQKKKCWTKWRMCGVCAVLNHPEEYSPMYVKHILTLKKKRGWQMNNGGRYKISQGTRNSRKMQDRHK